MTILGGVGVPTKTHRRKYAYLLPGLLDTVGVTGPAGVTFSSRKYGYNTGCGSLTSVTLGGRQTLFTLDGNYRPTGIKYPALDTVGTTFGNLGLPEKVIAGNGTGGNPSYGAQFNRWLGQDGVGRLSQQLFRNDATGQEGRFFQFDSLGQLRVRRDQHTPFVPPVTCPDPNFGMLFAGCQPGGGSGWITDTTKTYAYDLGGNRTDNGGAYTGNRITGFNNCTYTTDADGNVTGRSGGSCAAGTASFVWNAEGQLDSVQTATQGVKYFYDAAGRLVFKRVNNTPTAFQLWDGGNPIADLNGLATAKTTEYSYFPGLDSPHAFIWNGRTCLPVVGALRKRASAQHGRKGAALGVAAFVVGLVRVALRTPDELPQALGLLVGVFVFYVIAGWVGGVVYGALRPYRTSAVRAAMVGFVVALIPCALLAATVTTLTGRYSGMGWSIVHAWLFASAVVGCGGGLIDWFVRKLVERQFGSHWTTNSG